MTEEQYEYVANLRQALAFFMDAGHDWKLIEFARENARPLLEEHDGQ